MGNFEMGLVPAFYVLVVFALVVVSLAAQTTNNGQTAAQRLEAPSSSQQYPSPQVPSNNYNYPSGSPQQASPALPINHDYAPPINHDYVPPVNHDYAPPISAVPFSQSPRPPAPPTIPPEVQTTIPPGAPTIPYGAPAIPPGPPIIPYGAPAIPPGPPTVPPPPPSMHQQDPTNYYHETTYPHYATVSVPRKVDEETCPSLEGDMDKLTLDQFSSRLTHECRYDKVTRPDSPDPLPVTLQIDIQHIEAIEQLQFKMHILLQYRYFDYRLRYDKISPRRGVMLGEELLRNKIWVPHIVLSNERESAIMGLEGNDLFVSLSPQGEVIFSYRMTATIYCWMDLKKFPFDSQNCDLTFRSWTYNASKLILYWDEQEPVKVANQLHLTEFTLARYSTFSKMAAASLSHGAFVGNYSLVVFEFLLQREIGYYIMDYFIPSILLVATSWVTFWLQADNAAPRITLGTSTMLAFITLAQGQSKHLPKVSYIKASEIWFLGCTVFIFASMVEFAFVNIIWRRKKKVELKKVNSKYILKSTLTPRLARKELQRSSSMNNLHKSHSCSSLSHCNNSNKNNSTAYNNYLTVHSFPSTLNLPTITTQSEDDLINADSQVTIPVPHKCNEAKDHEERPQSWTSMTPHEVAIWIDKRSRLVFPGAFLVFNIFYWAFVYGL